LSAVGWWSLIDGRPTGLGQERRTGGQLQAVFVYTLCSSMFINTYCRENETQHVRRCIYACIALWYSYQYETRHGHCNVVDFMRNLCEEATPGLPIRISRASTLGEAKQASVSLCISVLVSCIGHARGLGGAFQSLSSRPPEATHNHRRLCSTTLSHRQQQESNGRVGDIHSFFWH
jgi:hypothetical protein